MRAVKEWIGRTDNAMPPPKVRQRIFDRDKGICHICKMHVDPGQSWEADHVPPLKDGGENRESKIFVAHTKCHKKLTAKQAMERAPIERKKQKHSGAKQPGRKMQSRGFETKERRPKDPLPPRQIFRSAD